MSDLCEFKKAKKTSFIVSWGRVKSRRPSIFAGPEHTGAAPCCPGTQDRNFLVPSLKSNYGYLCLIGQASEKSHTLVTNKQLNSVDLKKAKDTQGSVFGLPALPFPQVLSTQGLLWVA